MVPFFFNQKFFIYKYMYLFCVTLPVIQMTFYSPRMCNMFIQELPSFIAAMLFAVHPIHTEAVSCPYIFFFFSQWLSWLYIFIFLVSDLFTTPHPPMIFHIPRLKSCQTSAKKYIIYILYIVLWLDHQH